MANKHLEKVDLTMNLTLKGVDQSIAAVVQGPYGKVRAILDAAASEYDAAVKSGDYSSEGLLKTKARIQTAAQETLRTFIGVDLERHRQGVAELRSKLAPAKRDIDEARMREVRDFIRSQHGNDAVKIASMYAGTSDQDIIDAIETAPAAFRWVSPEAIQQQRIERARRSNPEIAAQLDNAELTESILSGATREIERALSDLG